MQELEGSVKPIEVTFKVPALQWLRLRWLAEGGKPELADVVTQALVAGLDALGVPGTVAGVLDEGGHLQVAEEEAELAERWEANYISADGDPAGEEGKGDG